jgi:hypothetical protein
LHHLADDDGAGGVRELLELAEMLVDRAPRTRALEGCADEYGAVDRGRDGDRLFSD